MKNLLFYTTLLLLCTQCSSMQYTTDDDLATATSIPTASEYTVNKSDFKDGKCYAKVMIPDQYESRTEMYNVYTGDAGKEAVDLEVIEVETRPGGNQWVKKKADRNCQSADPDDCLVWCLVEVSAITETLTILKDTTQSMNYEIREVVVEDLAQKGGFTEWREIVCARKITKDLVNQIQGILAYDGFYSGKKTGKMDQATKAALTKFQKSKRLPVGNLDRETMNTLGINTGF